MVASFGNIAGWILAVVLTLVSLERSKAEFWVDPRSGPFIVVDNGVNNKEVNLVWKYSEQESRINSVTINRRRQGTSVETPIASRSGQGSQFPSAFAILNESLQSKYMAFEPATLRLLNVKNGEEYVYTITVQYYDAQNRLIPEENSVFVDVKVPPTITTPPASSVRPLISSSVNLTCEASGDPMPNITWTREGATSNQLVNATGPVLPFVNIQLNDAGSYRCTADNGYGVESRLSAVNIFCSSECNTSKVGIRLIAGAVWNSSLTDKSTRYYKWLVSHLTAAVSSPFSLPENAGKRPYLISVTKFSSGSVRAFLDLEFSSTLTDPLKPLREAVERGTLGQFRVHRYLEVDPTVAPSSSSTGPTTDTKEGPDSGARSSGLSDEAMWGIIGACIAVVVIVAVVIVVCCVCRKRKGSGANKGKYTEADGYRMNKQPPSSGLGTASPAYVEARMYAPPNATKKQDDQPPPLNYSELSFEKSDKQPPPRYNPEYADVAPEKRPPPSGGQQGEGGFELWC